MKDAFWDNKLVFWDEGLPGIKHCPCCGGVPVLKDDGYETPEIDSNGAYVGMDIYEPSLFWVECKDCGLSTKEQKNRRRSNRKMEYASRPRIGGRPMKANYVRNFAKERDEAMLSLDKDKIVAYCKKYGVPIPKNETVFWAGVHKTIIALNAATQEQKEKSAAWLVEHGFKPEIG